jgi:hypothetical protein
MLGDAGADTVKMFRVGGTIIDLVRFQPSSVEMPPVSNAPRVAVWGVLAAARKRTFMVPDIGRACL